jgi:serine/threonine protein kinase/Tol biopolymer transport system component
VSLTTGTKLGPYEVVAPLGAGGMGEVYRARDTRLQRFVAIKILPAHLSSDPIRKQRFEREAKTISSLNHPHICVLYDVGHQEGMDYLVMECIEGETLAKRLERGPLSLEQVVKFGMQIADALHKAHRSGVVHRDLKPGNIMLTPTFAKLLDFGLAKPAMLLPSAATLTEAATQTTPVTEQGTIVGTFQYMSPEQVEGKDVDGRSDIFSLGAVLYEMLTGRRAFEGKSQVSVASAILEKEPEPISTLKPMTPPALDHAIRRCLAKDREERWQTALDLVLELKWIAEAGSQAGVPAPMVSQRKLRERLAWAAAAAFALTTIAFAIGFVLRTPQPVQVVRSSLLPPQGSSFLPNNFAISPDGSRLAFVALGADGKTGLWLRSFSAPGAQQLSGTEGANFPFWSPDSRRIGFFAEGKLKTVDSTPGGVQILCEAPIGLGGTWNRNDTIVFAPRLAGPLYRISASGGVSVPVTKMARQGSGQAHRWPFFLPDGRHFLYFQDWSTPADTQGNGIYVGSLDSGDAHLISSELAGNVAFSSGNLLYVRDRTLTAQPFDPDRLEITGAAVSISEPELEKDLAFSRSGHSVAQNGALVFQSAADSPSRLMWFDASGKELGQLPGAGYRYPQIAPDGRFVAVSSDDERNGKYFIRIHDLARGISTRLTDAGNENENNPVWSRDGKQITYPAVAGNTYSIYQIPADGSGSPQLLLKGGKMLPNDWSADGHLVFMNLEKGDPVVYSASDHQVMQLVPSGGEAQFSPDGKWIAYLQVGRPSLYVFVQPFPGPGGRLQISSAGGAQPRWARDGRQVFYMAPDRKLMAVSFDPQKKSAGKPRVLFQTRIVAPEFALFQYDVAPDGRFLINSLPSNTSSPLTLLTGWNALLQGR